MSVPTSTVQAPQSPSRQPILVPFKERCSRIKSRRVMPGLAGVFMVSLLRKNFVISNAQNTKNMAL